LAESITSEFKTVVLEGVFLLTAARAPAALLNG
jgi:hypothetical protein